MRGAGDAAAPAPRTRCDRAAASCQERQPSARRPLPQPAAAAARNSTPNSGSTSGVMSTLFWYTIGCMIARITSSRCCGSIGSPLNRSTMPMLFCWAKYFTACDTCM